MGLGILNVIKDMGLKEPYIGQTILQTGEIGDDLTYYFANSEQVPSSVGLGVLMEKDNSIAGGSMHMVMPFVEEQVLLSIVRKILQDSFCDRAFYGNIHGVSPSGSIKRYGY